MRGESVTSEVTDFEIHAEFRMQRAAILQVPWRAQLKKDVCTMSSLLSRDERGMRLDVGKVESHPLHKHRDSETEDTLRSDPFDTTVQP